MKRGERGGYKVETRVREKERTRKKGKKEREKERQKRQNIDDIMINLSITK